MPSLYFKLPVLSDDIIFIVVGVFFGFPAYTANEPGVNSKYMQLSKSVDSFVGS